MQRHHDAVEQRRRVQNVDLGTNQATDIAGVRRDRLQITHLRALWLDQDRRFRRELLRHLLDEGRGAANPNCESQQNDPKVTPQDRFKATQRDSQRFEPAGGVVHGHKPHRTNRIAAFFSQIMLHDATGTLTTDDDAKNSCHFVGCCH